MNKWLALLSQIGPVVLASVPGGAALMPFIPLVMHGITTAEGMNKPGADKKAYVLDLLNTSIVGTNEALAVAGHTAVADPALVLKAADSGIDTVVDIINRAHASHVAATDPAAPASPASTI